MKIETYDSYHRVQKYSLDRENELKKEAFAQSNKHFWQRLQDQQWFFFQHVNHIRRNTAEPYELSPNLNSCRSRYLTNEQLYEAVKLICEVLQWLNGTTA